jgi:tetratricopeptide (TPR) repeat protein
MGWILLSISGFAQTTSRISSAFLARGEQALLEVSVIGGMPDEFPEISEVKNIVIQPTGRGPMPGRRREVTFEYIVAGYEPGNYTIPPIEVVVGGLKTTTEPLDFMIFNPDELEWAEVQIGERLVRYASSFRALHEQPYENQSTPTEIKIFVPEDLVVEDWGIPDFERDGVTAWRFQPSGSRSRINLLGLRYVSVAYPSVIAPTRTGSVSIGPARIRLTTREVIADPFARLVNPEGFLTVPKLDLEALPLPEGAPAGFENAVGSFKITAESLETEVEEGDPITVDLVVTGSGNLDTLKPPKLASAEGWKVYGTTTEQRGDERRQLSGSVVFHQSIRPLEMKSEIPPFRLVYFDPRDKAYKSIMTEAIPLQMRPGTALPSRAAELSMALPVPLERMSDILAVLRPAQLTLPAASALPGWLLHAIGGLLALGLILKAMWMRYAPRLRKDPVREARLKDLRMLEKSPSGDDPEFLRCAGGFIERWLGNNPDPAIHAVLAERDAVCFRDEKPKAILDRKRRTEILKLLRKAAVAIAFLATLGLATPLLRAEDVGRQALEAYDSGRYEEALKLWLGAGSYDELSADTLYNIGNACYRSGSPGQAALYYRRALARDASHQEARQNLRFIERKFGSISVQRPEYQYALARFSLDTWKGLWWAGAWLCGLALLVIPATRPGARVRILSAAALVVGPILAVAGLLGWRYFPNDAEFAPLHRQAVIIAENVALHTDAARTAPEVIDAPPGSLCEIIRESGRWAYVAFATKTRGWVPVESIEKVIPESPPVAPTFRKPRADGSSA